MANLKCILVVGVIVMSGSLTSAATFAVGACRPKLPSFPTITKALSSAPAGSLVLVCPGTYPEQITITQPVNLQGIVDSNAGRPVITVPLSTPGAPGLQVNVISQFTGVFLGRDFPFAAQVLVESPTPVFISDITVDGTGGDMGCHSSGIWLAGIFGNNTFDLVLRQVTTRNQLDEGCGNGIWVEDSASPGLRLTVQQSSIHDFDYAGILAATNGTDSWLSTAIQGNFVFSGAGSCQFSGCGGIAADFIDGVVSANLVTGGTVGINTLSSAPVSNISNNWIADTKVGILTGYDFGVIQRNEISNTSVVAIDLNNNHATVVGNDIRNSNVGIEFECNTDAVTAGDINDAAVAWSHVPTGLGISGNFENVDTILTGCSGSAGSMQKLLPPLFLRPSATTGNLSIP